MSGSTVGGVVGGIIGFYFGGPQGAQWGWMIGSAVGGYVDPEVIKGPRLRDAQTQTSMEGAPRAIVYGTAVVAGNIIQAGPIDEHKHRERAGKGGPVQETFSYTRSHAIRVCEGPITGIRRIWRDDKLTYDARDPNNPDDGYDAAAWAATINALRGDTHAFASKLTIYLGDESQLPDPTLEALPAAHGGGIGNVPAYRGTCYVVITDDDVTNRQGTLPQYRFEVVRAGSESADCVPYDPIFHWPLDDAIPGGVAQEVVQGYDGEYSAGVGSGPPLRAGSAGSTHFSANNEFMIADYADVFRIHGGHGWTWSVWCQPTELVAGSVMKNVGTLWASEMFGDHNWSLRLRDDSESNMTPNGSYSVSGNEYAVAAASPIGVFDTAYMVATYESATPSSGTIKLYLNGELVDTRSGIPAPDATGFYVNVGGYEFPNSYGFIGYVSDLMLFDYAFTEENAQVSYWSSMDYYEAPDINGAYVSRDGEIVGLCKNIVSSNQVTLSSILEDIADRVGLSAEDFDYSEADSINVRGFVIGQQMAGSAAVRALQQAYFGDTPEWDLKHRWVTRGGATIFSVTDDDLVESDDDDETRAQATEFPRKINLITADTAADYNPTKQTAERRTENVRAVGEATIELPVVTTRAEAAAKADIILKIAWTEAEGRLIRYLPDEFSRYTPSDCFTYTDKRWRLEKTETLDGCVKVEAVRDRLSALTSYAEAGSALPPTVPSTSLRGPTVFEAMNLPQLRTQDTSPGMYVLGCGLLPGWVGADLQMSVDGGVTFQSVLTITNPGILGRLTADLEDALGSGAEPASADVVGGELESITAAQMALRMNAFAILESPSIDSNGGTTEIGQFMTAVATGDRQYDLYDLQRGLLGTDMTGHFKNDSFVILDESLYFVPLDVSLAGRTIIFRPVSIGTVPANNATYSVVFRPQFTSTPVIDFYETELGEVITTETGVYLQTE